MKLYDYKMSIFLCVLFLEYFLLRLSYLSKFDCSWKKVFLEKITKKTFNKRFITPMAHKRKLS